MQIFYYLKQVTYYNELEKYKYRRQVKAHILDGPEISAVFGPIQAIKLYV